MTNQFSPLRNLLEQRDKVYGDIAEYLQLMNVIQKLQVCRELEFILLVCFKICCEFRRKIQERKGWKRKWILAATSMCKLKCKLRVCQCVLLFRKFLPVEDDLEFLNLEILSQCNVCPFFIFKKYALYLS